MSLKDKIVVITGASSGIGKACAEEFAKRGAHVVLAARQYVVLCEIAQEIQDKYHVRTLAIQTDVSNETECKDLMQQSIRTMGKIDVLVNNAGISMRALFKDLDMDVLKKVMDINFWGTVYCTKYAFDEILSQSGSIVGVSSIAGFKGLPGRTGYSASKFAMNGFMEALRNENLNNNLHIMVACPGFTASNIRNVALNSEAKPQGETSMIEEKMMTAEEVAIRIVNGVEARKRTLIMTGQGKLTVMLQKILPKFLDNLVYNHFKKEKDPLIS
ncbi:MAG: SDR family oxidoreductase [Bacteroidetes bacterium]|nr:SDR family oxidoreductase [Bacteroidota bacterium]MBU1372100.1 SDR family oxidoreductase [Bacteroidota bacterium]MBU1484021.1 SDR family oxidoreductase [Bacteroidota bacterium]MBU1761336.1 SDR family oxidoreductase [Bacteroidota bacterium]MBU2268778.1 SDR family oxidoreductase [Bacteroidota bacterium]